MLSLARHVTLVLNLKCFQRTSYIELSHHSAGVSDANIRDSHRGSSGGRPDRGDGHHVDDIELVTDKTIHVERKVSRLPEVKDERVAPPRESAQLKREQAG